jgi:hypothetical protein
MALPWLTIIAKTVPWVELVRRTPDILARSRELLEASRRQREPVAALSEADVLKRIEALEARDAEHARIIAPIVDQLAGLTDAVEVLTARMKLLAWIVGALVVLQITTLALVLR